MNELRMKSLLMRTETYAADCKTLIRLSRDDKRLEGLFATAQECFLLARERANENLKAGEIVKGEVNA